jgi:cytochrome P450 family 135
MKPTQLPPGPRTPRAVQAMGWARRPLSFMATAQLRYGDIFTLRIRRGSPWVLLCDPEDARRVFTAGAETLCSAAAQTSPLLAPLLGPSSMMLLDEPDHMAHRRLMLPSFHGERLRGYEQMIGDVCRREVASWPVGEPLVLWPRMQAISLAVVMRAVFGDADGEHLRRLRVLLGRLTAWLNDPRRLALLNTIGSPRTSRNDGFRAVIEPVEVALLEEVRRRRATPAAQRGEDILSLLLETHDADGAPMSEQELRDELITLLSDGPTSTSLAWTFDRLARHPDKLARLRDEALAAEGEAYADAVVRETLRLCPAAPLVMRRLRQPMDLGGYTIPANTIVAPCVYLIHRRADVYPNPRSFLPERFLERPPGTYTWVPFGGGARRCVAASFAQLLMKRVLQTVVGEVDLRVASLPPVRATRSWVAFAPGQRGTVAITRRRMADPGNSSRLVVRSDDPKPALSGAT